MSETDLLAGLTVIDLSTTAASAMTTLLFADFGAEVIMVEPPGGSSLRSAAAWPYWLRGKRSISLDLKHPSDRETAHALLAGADVAVEAWGPGVASRLGVGFEEMSRRNPALVYTSISGFGHEGPYAHLKAYEAIVMAKTGSMYGNTAMHRPGPVMTNPLGATFSGALLAMHGTLVALHERARSGFGQRVDATMVQGMMAQDPWVFFLLQLAQKYPSAYTTSAGPSMAGHRAPPPSWLGFGLLNGASKDGQWLQFAHATPVQFDAFLHALELGPEWRAKADDEDPTVRDELWTEMLSRVRARTLEEWLSVFDAEKHVFAEQYRSGTELFEHPQIVHDHHAVQYEQTGLGTVRAMGPLVKVVGPPTPAMRPTPEPDADGPALRAHPPTPKARPEGNPPAPRPPLEDVTVVDLGTFYAGPFGSTMFADLGARVIKLEQLEGDPIRFNMPVPETAGVRVTQGKESIAVDISTPEGKEIATELIRRADIVLHCYREGAAKRLGLDADAMLALKPDLLYHHGVGYGVDGPYARRSAFAPTIAAGSGFAARCGGTGGRRVDDSATIEDIKDGSANLGGAQSGHPDGQAALAVAVALSLLLVSRDLGGGGRVALTSMMSTIGHALGDLMIEYEGKPEPAWPDPDQLGYNPLYRLYEASDGWIMLCAPTEEAWRRLCKALPTLDPGRRNDPTLGVSLEDIIRTRPADEWEQELSAAGVGCGAVTPYVGALGSGMLMPGQVGERLGFTTSVEHPIFGDYVRTTALVRFSRGTETLRPGCTIGQHTDAVLAGLGYDRDRIEALRTAGVVGG